MKLLIVGSGGREHALAWKLAQSPLAEKIYCAPGNPGTEAIPNVENRPELLATYVDPIVNFARQEKIDLVVVGPEAPLVAGMADRLRTHGIPTFGPSADGAKLEGSKVWAKDLMRKHGLPTSAFKSFRSISKARQYLEAAQFPIVIKADGLAAGKGVVIAKTLEQAEATVEQMMVDGIFGDAGRQVVIEDFMSGPEVSVLAITDGRTILTLPSAQDHKAVYDGDKGPNTGGMGAFSPTKTLTDKLAGMVDEKILVPIVHALRLEEIDYRGVIYAGLMLTKGGPRTLEFNVRFGDPETQPILVRLKSDLLPVLHAAALGKLDELPPDALQFDPRPAVCVVMCAGGYPGSFEKGHVIAGISAAQSLPGVMVFQAGTARNDDGQIVTAGGRVLGVTAIADTVLQARQTAYEAVKRISFKDAHYRTDIAAHAKN